MVNEIEAPRVYLDNSCLGHPFDDQSQERVRLEAEAVLAILDRYGSGEFVFVSSTMNKEEAVATPDATKRLQVLALLTIATVDVESNEAVRARAISLRALGFKKADAEHLALAEAAKAAVFLTCDDRLLRLAARQGELVKVMVATPLTWPRS